MKFPYSIFAILFGIIPANADGLCLKIEVPKGRIEQHNGKWIEVTEDQLNFLRGVYLMNPNTPPGLPFGDKAVIASVPGNDGVIIFFIDKDKACNPMPIPKELIEVLDKIGSKEVTHDQEDGTDN